MLPEPLQLSLAQPAWLAALLAIPLVCLAAWRSLTCFSPGRHLLLLAIRGLAVLALVLALAGPLLSGLPRPVYPVFLIDASASIAPASAQAAEEFVGRAQDARAGRRSAIVRFAASAAADHGEGAELSVDRSATDLAAALELALAVAPPDTAPHVVLFSDGVPTRGDTPRAIEAARNAGVPVSTVPLASCDPEVYVADIRAPRVVREGEAFDMEVTVFSTQDNQGTLKLTGLAGETASRRVDLKKGETRVAFSVSLEGGRSQETPLSRRGRGAEGEGILQQTLAARISGFRDTLAENNAAETVVSVLPPYRVFLVESQPSAAEHLAKSLRAGRLTVETVAAREMPDSLDELSRFDAVVLVNVPAAALAERPMEFLKQYVLQGGGLVTIGGDQAFAAGGYRGTVLEEILPLVSEPLRNAARPPLAMVLVVDRSLSMEEGGAIDLAREAIRRAVQLLQPEDQLGVLAFDEEARWVSPIGRLGDKAKVLQRIASITADGRTDMGPALEKAHLALRESFAAQKHILLLTDGISHPADFEGLAERIARDGITISTVALGKEASRPLLEDLARIGKGRSYACDTPQGVPSVFALETASASKLGIREGPFFARAAASNTRLDGLDLSAAPSLLGYAETRPRPEARIVLTSADGDPLLARFRIGEGTSVAFTSDCENRWAAAWLTWPGFGRFWTTVIRGALRSETEKRCQEPFSRNGSTLGKIIKAKTVPDTFSRFYPDEFRIRPADRDLLRRIAETTGGIYQPEPESVWQVATPGELPPMSLRHYFLLAAAVLLVLEAAARRS